MSRLKRHRLVFGTAITLTRHNFPAVMEERFMRILMETGCSLVFTIDYVPIEEGTEGLVLTGDQIAAESGLMAGFRKRFPGVFVAFPGDEDRFGGCMSSGRGFIHVSAEGDVEPCPASPYSDANLKESSLRDALQSRLLTTIRANRRMLSETGGTCALWENREWVESLLPGKQAR
jgi:MoaA/NifB/PqqE/SkfB family radical SAM enzyme